MAFEHSSTVDTEGSCVHYKMFVLKTNSGRIVRHIYISKMSNLTNEISSLS